MIAPQLVEGVTLGRQVVSLGKATDTVLSMIQELRAKRTLDRLAIVGKAKPRVRRDGRTVELDSNEVALVMGKKPGTVRVIQKRALEQLATLLAAHAEGVVTQ